MATVAKGGVAERSPSLIRVVEDLRALKNRVLAQELARLEEDRARSIAGAAREAESSKGRLSPEEARRYAEAECDRNREMVETRFARLEAGIAALEEHVKESVSVEEHRRQLELISRTLEEKSAKIEADRATLDRRMKEFEEKYRGLVAERMLATEKNRDLETRLKDTDLVERAKLLEEREVEVRGQVKTYNEEMKTLARMREELNRDFDNLGRMRAELDQEQDQLASAKKAEGAAPAAAVTAATVEEIVTRISRGVEKVLRETLTRPTAEPPAAPPAESKP